MANSNIFKSNPGNVLDSNIQNEAGGKAYNLPNRAALSQLVLTGTLHNVYYSTAEDQLKKLLEFAENCDLNFIAKLAVYARTKGLLKDTPALLVAFIAAKDSKLLRKVFPLVINDGKMLRNFMQIIRSGVVGRKSFGSTSKKLIHNFLNNLTDEQLFKSNIGNEPSLSDIIKMVHPKATNPARNALYAYIIGKDYDTKLISDIVNKYEAFKKDLSLDIPNVPFQMLTSLELTEKHWKHIASRCTWTQARMNLNSYLRHNVFDDKELSSNIAKLISNKEEVKRAKVFPYQLFATFLNVDEKVPAEIKIAIQQAAEYAIENVPVIEGNVICALDVSGSMRQSVSGNRGSATSKMSYIDVASMFAAAIIKKNPLAVVIPFDTTIKKVDLNPLDSTMTNSKKLADAGVNGGTDCSVVLKHLNDNNIKADVVIYISDNQSWMGTGSAIKGETEMMRQWTTFNRKHPSSRLVNIDIAPYAHAQVYSADNILHCSGFSDQTFEVVSDFIKSAGKDLLVKTIENISIDIVSKLEEETT